MKRIILTLSIFVSLLLPLAHLSAGETSFPKSWRELIEFPHQNKLFVGEASCLLNQETLLVSRNRIQFLQEKIRTSK